MRTRADAREYLITVFEAGAAGPEEFDLEGILDEIFAQDLAPDWDLECVSPLTFWGLVAKHVR